MPELTADFAENTEKGGLGQDSGISGQTPANWVCFFKLTSLRIQDLVLRASGRGPALVLFFQKTHGHEA